MDNEKKKNLEKLQNEFIKEFGKGSIFSGVSKEITEIEKWDLTSIKLKNLLGGGFPKGRVIEIYGSESSGKTTLATIIAGDIQKQGGVIFYIDMEHAFDPIYAKKIGLDTDKESFLFSQPDSGEEALEMAERAISSGIVSLIVIDSVSALVPKAELEGDMGDSHIGLQARLMSQALRKLTALLSNNNASIIFINQIRQKIGVMFGSPETTSGGNALKFYASIRMDVRRIEWLKHGDEVYGQKIRIKTVKNKVSSPFKKEEFDLEFGKGFNIYKEYLDFGISYDLIEKAGTWYSYKKEKLGQGKDNASNYLKEHPKVFEMFKKELKQVMYPQQQKENATTNKEVKVRKTIKPKVKEEETIELNE